jgi:N-acetylneuraminic acid mutarotase
MGARRHGGPIARALLVCASVWLLACGAAGGGAGDVDASTPRRARVAVTVPSDEWAPEASLPSPRSGLGLAAADGAAFAVGGCQGDATLGEVLRLGPTGWTARAPLPTPRCDLAVAVVDGRIFAIGGRSGASALAAVEVYDPAADRWEARAPLPAARTGIAAAALDGKLYVVGGLSAAVDVYDPALDAWTRAAPLPRPRLAPVAVALSGLVYAVGGDASGRAVDAYDPATDTWSTRAAMPTARWWAGGAVRDGLLTVAGGLDALVRSAGARALRDAEVYDPQADRWVQTAPLRTLRAGPGVAAVGGALLAAGGAWCPEAFGGAGAAPACQGEFVDLAEAERADGPPGPSWTADPGDVGQLPTPRAFAGAAVLDGVLYLAGGDDGRGPLDAVLTYDPAQRVWTPRKPLAVPRSGPVVAALDGRLYVVAGTGADGEAVSEVEVYDPALDAWTAAAPFPGAARAAGVYGGKGSGFAGGASGGQLVVVGGFDDARWSYDPAADAWRASPGLPRGGLAVVVDGDQLLTVGGDYAAAGEIDRDPWIQEGALWQARWWGAAAALDGRLYTLGGSLDPTVDPLAGRPALVERCTPDACTAIASLSRGRLGLAAAALEGAVYAIGGEDPGGPLPLVERYVPEAP